MHAEYFWRNGRNTGEEQSVLGATVADGVSPAVPRRGTAGNEGVCLLHQGATPSHGGVAATHLLEAGTAALERALGVGQAFGLADAGIDHLYFQTGQIIWGCELHVLLRAAHRPFG